MCTILFGAACVASLEMRTEVARGLLSFLMPGKMRGACAQSTSTTKAIRAILRLPCFSRPSRVLK